MMTQTPLVKLSVLLVSLAVSYDTCVASPDQYNVVWDSPSRDFNGSMPLGNGDIGLNAWIEPSGDLLFYISKTDAWDDNGRLVKVGLVRVKFDPALPTAPFLQTLVLREGAIRAVYGDGPDATTVRLWVDANRPVVHVTVDGPKPITATASIELWRTKPDLLTSPQCSDLMEDRSKPGNLHQPVTIEPDTLLQNQVDRIGWYHHNAKSVGPATIAKIQGLSELAHPDPLLHRTFGAVITARDGKRIDDRQLRSPSATSHQLAVHVLAKYPSTSQAWLSAMNEMIDAAGKTSFSQRRQAHEQWWSNFWDRSWIHVTTGDVGMRDDAFVVSQSYALQRHIDACAGRGRYPIKFNGSIFTVPHQGQPDYRRWGPGYWWQNTRLPYLSMCASGDTEMILPLFRMYANELMPLHKYRTKIQTGADGAFIPECIYFWGPQFSSAYGWTPIEHREDKLQEAGWHKWEWVGGPELVFMMLNYYEYTLDNKFLADTLLPTAHEILTFFDSYYKTDDTGKLVMHPAMACETWWDCTNPMPELAGLHAVTARLIALPDNLTTAKQRTFWTSLQKKLPPLPTLKVDNQLALAPAMKFANKRNQENPELYAVFPFRLVSFEKDNVDLGIQALEHRLDRGNSGWRQDDIFMAYLGLADDARKNLVGRAKNHCKSSRFPAFWGPNYDWVPDQDHGGVLMKTLQAMLIQTEGEKIFLLPAWPENWNVSFRLHAPYRTIVEGEVRDGKIVQLNVTPAERRKDVILPKSSP